MWAPIVMPMGRAAEHGNFDAFRAAVMDKRFDDQEGELTCVSEAGDEYEYWAQGVQPPRINDAPVDLNPGKIFDSPLLEAARGETGTDLGAVCPGEPSTGKTGIDEDLC